MKEVYEYMKAIDVEISLANTPQVTFEITDACNLNCTYCGYGKYYSDYDVRENKKLSPNKAILLLQHLSSLWESPLNNSINKNVYISFYGGEPTLNMPFIKRIVDYVENKINCKTRKFSFSMTTNAILLDKYMDYLVAHNFNLLISLDGNKHNTSYRLDHKGNHVFEKIVMNVDLLKKVYPDYFDKRVNFNAVLHNRNSVESIYHFFKENYNKVPNIGELNNAGIRPEMQKKFSKTYRNPYESLFESENYEEIERDMFLKSVTYQSISTYLLQHNKFIYKDYNELLFGKQTHNFHIPTGTCIPFTKKVYVTVNGKILPCERIGHQFALGELTENKVIIDFDAIAQKYNFYYNQLNKKCEICQNKKACIQCVFNLSSINKQNVICHGFMSRIDFEAYKNRQLNFLIEHPDAYHKIMTEVLIK